MLLPTNNLTYYWHTDGVWWLGHMVDDALILGARLDAQRIAMVHGLDEVVEDIQEDINRREDAIRIFINTPFDTGY